ncbi:nucleotidyltransferase domain-containing protein [Candidatus Daviesbacteria bacterium]|nr:nucleotidyltransferase domain-containing protein [Candidatus Daviesbacteria bacterium]
MIDDKLISQIQQALSKEPKIKLAYVLGSTVSGRVKTDSDFDLAVVTDDKAQVSYDQIYQLISGLSFPKDLDLSIVDKNSSPLFLFQITSTGECVYQKSDTEGIAFEAYAMKNYYDTAHLRSIYSSYLKERFPYAH